MFSRRRVQAIWGADLPSASSTAILLSTGVRPCTRCTSAGSTPTRAAGSTTIGISAATPPPDPSPASRAARNAPAPTAVSPASSRSRPVRRRSSHASRCHRAACRCATVCLRSGNGGASWTIGPSLARQSMGVGCGKGRNDTLRKATRIKFPDPGFVLYLSRLPVSANCRTLLSRTARLSPASRARRPRSWRDSRCTAAASGCRGEASMT